MTLEKAKLAAKEQREYLTMQGAVNIRTTIIGDSRHPESYEVNLRYDMYYPGLGEKSETKGI